MWALFLGICVEFTILSNYTFHDVHATLQAGRDGSCVHQSPVETMNRGLILYPLKRKSADFVDTLLPAKLFFGFSMQDVAVQTGVLKNKKRDFAVLKNVSGVLKPVSAPTSICLVTTAHGWSCWTLEKVILGWHCSRYEETIANFFEINYEAHFRSILNIDGKV